MTTQHTPGPWFIAKDKPRRVCGKNGVSICNAILRNQGGPKAKAHLKDEHEAEANALLMSCAPELLESVEALLLLVPDAANSPICRLATTLVARATGVIPATPLPRVENVR
jgi:hypothetical protein